MRKFLFALPVLALASCAAPGPDPYLQAQIGKSEIDLVRAMGVPSRSYESEGHKFIAYERSQQWVDDWGGPGWRHFGYWGPAEITNYTCETSFELIDGRVAGYINHGNGCG